MRDHVRCDPSWMYSLLVKVARKKKQGSLFREQKSSSLLPREEFPTAAGSLHDSHQSGCLHFIAAVRLSLYFQEGFRLETGRQLPHLISHPIFRRQDYQGACGIRSQGSFESDKRKTKQLSCNTRGAWPVHYRRDNHTYARN